MPPRSTLMTIAATAAASLAFAAPASADSISYIKDGNVFLTTPDGGRHFQVTSSGVYSYASQADDGTFIALAGERLHKLDRLGNVLADFATPVSDGPPPPNTPDWSDTKTNYFNGPYDPEISPDGTKVSYTYYWQHYTFDYMLNKFRNRLESGTAITHTDRLTAWDEFGGNLSGWVDGSWVDNDTLARSDAGVPLAEDVVFNDIAPGGGGELRRWFRNYAGYDRSDPELNRRQTMLALSGEAAPPTGRHLGVYRTVGGLEAEPEACFGIFDDDQRGRTPNSPSWSPDGTRLAWEDSAGVKTLTVGDLSQACAIPADDIKNIAPGAKQPDWGPADVPTGRPTPPPPPDTGPKESDPVVKPIDEVDKDDKANEDDQPAKDAPLAATVTRTKLAGALKRGLTVKLTAPGAGTVKAVAKKGSKTVGKGSGKTTAPGARSVRVKFTPAGRKALRRLKKAPLTIALSFKPKSGKTVKQTVKVTLKK